MTFPKSFQVGGSIPIPLTISNKTAAYTVVAGDAGTVINCTSGTFTVSLTAAATLASGFNVRIINTGTGTITIDPSGAETLDANTTWQLSKGQGLLILCDGTNFQTLAIRTSGQAANTVALGNNSGGTPSVAITGAGAMALGGSYASGTDSFAAAIANNSSSYGATGANSIAMGRLAVASVAGAVAIGREATSTGAGGYSIAIGYQAAASSPGAIAIGNQYGVATTVASNTSAIAIGDGVKAQGRYSIALGAAAQSVEYGKYSKANGFFAAIGDNQVGGILLRVSTTGATPIALTSDAGAASTTNQLILPNSSAYTFFGTIVARQQAAGGTAAAAFQVEGLIRREANAASTTLVASAINTISNVPGWVIALTADTTNGGLAVTCTGAAATNIRWVATLNTSELTYA